MRPPFRSLTAVRRNRSPDLTGPGRTAPRLSHSLREWRSADQLELKAIARLRLKRCLKPGGLARIAFRKPVDLAERKSFGIVSGHLALFDAHPMVTHHKAVSGLKRLQHKPSLSVSATNCSQVVLQRVEGHERPLDGRAVERYHSRRRKRRRPTLQPPTGRSGTADARNGNRKAKERHTSNETTQLPFVTGRDRTFRLRQRCHRPAPVTSPLALVPRAPHTPYGLIPPETVVTSFPRPPRSISSTINRTAPSAMAAVTPPW